MKPSGEHHDMKSIKQQTSPDKLNTYGLYVFHKANMKPYDLGKTHKNIVNLSFIMLFIGH